MKKVLTKAAVSLVMASLLTACGGGEEPDALPQISLADSSAVKEKKSVTIMATATDDKSVIGFDWQQVSGPALILTQNKTASVVVTAPAVDADSTAVLRLTVTDSGNQTAQKTINVNIANNKAPVLNISNTTTPEKSTGKLSVTATDSDGSVMSYVWQQTAGPAVTLTDANTASPTFTAPAVTAQTNLSFSVKVTDDDSDFTEASSNVTVEQKFVSYTIEGTAPAAAFHNAEVVLTAGDVEFVTKATALGSFSLVAKTDDDAPQLSFGQLKVKSATSTGLEYYAFLRDFQPDAQLTANTSNAVKTLTVNEASTALFALIKQANKGVVPAELNKYLFLEKSLVAAELMEAAAVAKIAAQGVHKLPAGQSLLDVLADTTLYSNYVSVINAAEPDAVNKAIAAIIADPELTPPLSLAEIPSSYYQMIASGERFLTRIGTIYQLHKDGSGTRSSNPNPVPQLDQFNWSLVNGALELRFAPENGSISYVSLNHRSIQALGAPTVKLLQDNNIAQIAVRMGTAKVVLQRTIKGSQVDSFRVSVENSVKVLPLTVAGETLDPPAFIETFSSDQVLRHETGNPLKYVTAELNDTSLTIPHKYSLNTSEVVYREQMQFDVLDFKTNGSGRGKISHLAFNWQVSAAGKLLITFEDGEKTELTKFDEGFGYHSAIASIFDTSGQLLANWGTWIIKNDLESLKEKEAVNTPGFYWQSTVNLWRKDCWKQDIMLLICTSMPDSSWFFGWEINTWPKGVEHSYGRSSTDVSWEYDFDWVVIKRNQCGNSDCSRRVWWALQYETVNGKPQVWVLEGNASRTNDQAKYDMDISFRIVRYDELPLNYPNEPQ